MAGPPPVSFLRRGDRKDDNTAIERSIAGEKSANIIIRILLIASKTQRQGVPGHVGPIRHGRPNSRRTTFPGLAAPWAAYKITKCTELPGVPRVCLGRIWEDLSPPTGPCGAWPTTSASERWSSWHAHVAVPHHPQSYRTLRWSSSISFPMCAVE